MNIEPKGFKLLQFKEIRAELEKERKEQLIE